MSSIDLILKAHGLRKTTCRRELLSMFVDVASSLTVEEIHKRLETEMDKTTVYRTLDTFESSGLIHRVPDKKNLTRFALCKNGHHGDGHSHDHAHFICNQCEETFCLPEVNLPPAIKVEGYQVNSLHLTLGGICDECAQKAKSEQVENQ